MQYISFIEKMGSLLTYFFIFCILASTLIPYFGMAYGKFYNFVSKYSEIFYKLFRKRISYRYRTHLPFIALAILYLINYLFFQGSYYQGVLLKGSGIFYIMNLDFPGFGVHFLLTILGLINSIINFFIILFIIKAVLNISHSRNSRLILMISNITNIVSLKIRRILRNYSFGNYEEIITIGILIALKIVINSVYNLL